MKRQLALVLLLLAACGRDPFHGVVIAKSYEPSHTFTTVSTVCNGKTCMPVISVSTTPECYAIVVKQDTGESVSDCIDDDQWSQFEVGDRVDEEDQ